MTYDPDLTPGERRRLVASILAPRDVLPVRASSAHPI